MIIFPGDDIRGYPSTQSQGAQVKSVGGAEKYNMINADSINVRNIDASTASIKDLSVVTAKIADLAVSTAKIANLAVNEAKIADLAVTNAKINDLSAVKITAGTLSVGGTSQPTAILIGQSTLTGNARLAWVGGSRIWEDTSANLGINAIGGTMIFYMGSSEIARFSNDGGGGLQTSLRLAGSNLYFNYLDAPVAFSVRDRGLLSWHDTTGGRDRNVIQWGNGTTFGVDSTGGWIHVNGTDKLAIVPTSKGFRALYCMESPEVWFMDFCKGRKIRKWPKFWQTDWVLSLNDLFLEVTEQPYIVMPTTSKGIVQVWAKRKGMAYKRFEQKTKEEYDRNNDFWSQPMRMAKENEKKEKIIR